MVAGRRCLLLVVGCGLLLASPAFAQELRLDAALALLPPAGAHALAQRQPTQPWNGAVDQLLGAVLLRLYRSTLARTDIDACVFSPSCSHYAEQAIGQKGWIRGILAGADRLLRDHPGAGQLGYPEAPDGRHYLDPVEAPCSDCDPH